ncbi:MAG: type II CAAX endopeptidase family protein [Pyrinomonadaceae bacterium]
MTLSFLIFDRQHRLRAGWRLLIFTCCFLLFFSILAALAWLLSYAALGRSPAAVENLFESSWSFVIQGLLLITAATITGWGCNRFLEHLPRRALGWARHRHWERDLLYGSFVGGGSMLLAVGIAAAGGGLRFEVAASDVMPYVLRTLVGSGAVFILAAAAEEALFRGYPLQTLLRSWPAWAAALPSSLAFAYVHLGNPNIARGWTLVNTALAGVWLAVAYIKTRSLWFPLGAHWAWNWMMGAVLGLPVSGITALTPQPVWRRKRRARMADRRTLRHRRRRRLRVGARHLNDIHHAYASGLRDRRNENLHGGG